MVVIADFFEKFVLDVSDPIVVCYFEKFEKLAQITWISFAGEIGLWIGFLVQPVDQETQLKPIYVL